ncbi:T9SS type A sorting domain-containing protein [Flavobacterium sp. 3HN19-14]|uniref:T9SS type A sorting domain-containing protein n=1 Tax=Flavobacterium sp. 3HN19-14 TaxID=3448133 RepID=UPI003EE269DB
MLWPAPITGRIITQTNSGTSESNRIVFKKYGSGTVYIDGGGFAAQGTSIWLLRNISYITIQGFTFQNIIGSFVVGLQIRQNSNFITVDDCKFTGIHFSNDPSAVPVSDSDNANPLLIYSESASQPDTNIVFSNNEIFNCRTGRGEGMTVTGNVDGFMFRDNYLHDLPNIGIDAKGHGNVCSDTFLDQARNGFISHNTLVACYNPSGASGAIYVDGGKNIVVERNTMYNGSVGISVGCEKPGTASEIKVLNNVAYNNLYGGIWIGGSDPGRKVTNSLVSGNTLYHNDTIGNWAGELNVQYCDNLTAYNNIMYSNNIHNIIYNDPIGGGTGNFLNYNLFYSDSDAFLFTINGASYSSLSLYQAGTGNDNNSYFSNPMFVNAENQDFHLATTSPANNHGNPAYVPIAGELDIDGNARIVGTIDLGAYESAPLAIEHITKDSIKLFPVPSNDFFYIEGEASIKDVKLYNAIGQEFVLDTQADNSMIKCNTANLPDGFYYVSIKTHSSSFTKKIVIKH